MRKLTILLMVSWIMVICSDSASAQLLPGISEITGYGGMTFNGDSEATAGVALTVNITPRLGIEGEVGMIFAKEQIINVNADVIFNLGSGTSAIVPYLIGGAGILNNGGTDIALNLGAGLKLFVEPNIALRADFRGFLSSEGGDVHDLERLYGGIDFFF
jgi:hypothetical protein